jgi:hypothetical protein
VITESQFHIPCLCGALVLTHAGERSCERCGRLLVVEWGKGPGSVEEAASGAETRKEMYADHCSADGHAVPKLAV